MVAIYVFYYVSVNFCYHTHTYGDMVVSHSHPWSSKTHNHTASSLQTISAIASSTVDAPEMETTIGNPDRPEMGNLLSFYREPVSNNILTRVSLRGPPESR